MTTVLVLLLLSHVLIPPASTYAQTIPDHLSLAPTMLYNTLQAHIASEIRSTTSGASAEIEIENPLTALFLGYSITSSPAGPNLFTPARVEDRAFDLLKIVPPRDKVRYTVQFSSTIQTIGIRGGVLEKQALIFSTLVNAIELLSAFSPIGKSTLAEKISDVLKVSPVLYESLMIYMDLQCFRDLYETNGFNETKALLCYSSVADRLAEFLHSPNGHEFLKRLATAASVSLPISGIDLMLVGFAEFFKALKAAQIVADIGVASYFAFHGGSATSQYLLRAYRLSGGKPPAAPRLLSPIGENIATNAPLVWQSVNGATSYRVQLSTGATFSSLAVNQQISATSFAPSPVLQSNTNYFWRVMAINAAGTSPPAAAAFRTGSVQQAAPIQGSCTSTAAFVSDVTFPDGTTMAAGQSFVKTWRIRNTGTCTWTGYSLAFTNGNQLGAPGSVSVPTTAPNQTADISVTLTAPQAGGRYQGNWQLKNAQGVSVSSGGGGTVWVNIQVKTPSSGGSTGSPSGHMLLFDANPPAPSPAQRVRLVGRIRYFPEFRSMRFVAGNQAFGEQANLRQIGDQLEISADWDTSTLPRGSNAVSFEIATKNDPNWANPERHVMSYTLTGSPAPTGRPPDRPALKEPYDWFLKDAAGASTGVQMCVHPSSDPDGNPVQYYFEMLDGPGNPVNNSGWTGSTCWQPTVSPGTYGWRARAGDGSNESGWSQETWHFSVAQGGVSIGGPAVHQVTDADETHICVPVTYGGIQGPEVRAWINLAADGTENGPWALLDHYGPSAAPDCTQANVHGWWIRSQRYVTGPHVIRVSATKPDSGASATTTFVHTIPFMRPPAPKAVTPASFDINGTWWGERTITFQWDPDIRSDGPNPPLRTDSYELRVSTQADPWSDSSPVLDVPNIPAGATSYSHTFSQDHARLYWSVRARNSAGAGDSGANIWFGIDRVDPGCTVQTITGVQTDSVFQVSWAGTDNAAGVRSFDIQYQDTSRPGSTWTDWLVDVPAAKTFDLFNGLPGHGYAFRCRATDRASNQADYPSTPSASTRIDLTARPATAWWNDGYGQKRNLVILNQMPTTDLPAGYPVHLRFDGSTSPTAAELYAASASSQKCNDLRVVFNDATELDRLVTTCTSSTIDLWFRSSVAIAAASSNTSAHQLYYAHAGAGGPPADPSKVWYPFKEADTHYLYFFQEGSGSTTADASGNNRTCSINPSVQWAASKFGQGLRFNRANSGDSRSLNCGAAAPLSSFTIEFWYKPESDGDGRIAGQVAGGGNGGGGNNWGLSIFEGRLRLDVWPCPPCGSSEVRSNVNLRQAPYLGNWNHIAVTFNGGNDVRFYVNGGLDSARTLGQSGLNTFTPPFEIGSTEGGGQLKGNLGALRVSSGVKTSFPYGAFAAITTEPRTDAGTAIPRPQPVTGTPDLAVLALSTYTTPSGKILAEVVVQNQGARDTQNGFYTDLYLNHQPTGPGDFTGSVRAWVADPIAPGQIIALTAEVELPGVTGAAVPAGVELSRTALNAPPAETTYTLHAQTDSTGALGSASQPDKTISSSIPVCFAAQDSYEDDDSKAAAKPIGAPGVTQTRNFHRAGDEDWLTLTATAGRTYTITTSNLGLASDTVLTLYAADGATVLATNDDAGANLASRIEWRAAASGTVYLKVTGWSSNAGGCGTTYDLAVSTQASATLTVTKAGNGSGTVASQDGAITCDPTCSSSTVNGTVTLTATPASGSVFVGWGGACTGVGVCSVTVDGDKSVSATFRPQSIRHLIPGDVNRDGLIDQFDVTIVSQNMGQNACGNLADVNGDCKVDLFDYNTVLSNLNKVPVTITVRKTGSGGGTVESGDTQVRCGADCSGDYASGDTVTLTARAVTSGTGVSSFAGWGGACASSGNSQTCTLAVNKDESVSATFQTENVGVVVGPAPVAAPEAKALSATITARPSCSAISRIQFGEPGRAFDNANVSVTSPVSGPKNQTSGFDYRPPAGTRSVEILVQRVVQNGGATVNPIRLTDSCGEWQTFVGGGPEAFR
ncbi:MAG: hypothetical protein IT306_09565 [Chloroflexi bacterium]|nr:hypothetical protein [Chloroflexota bacterium]